MSAAVPASPAEAVGSPPAPSRPVSSEDGLPRTSFHRDRPTRATVERPGGRLLRLMKEKDRYRALGFVRLGDYVAERLGISYRTAQEMMRVDEALEGLPALAAAFAAGEVSAGHVRVLARVARPETEAHWLGLARKLGVKELARAVARSVEAGQEPSPPVEAADAEPELRRREILSTAWIGGLWRRTVTLVRRLTGWPLPPGACFDAVLAEVAGDVPLPEGEAASPMGRRALGEPVEASGARPPAAEAAELHAAAPGVRPEAPELHAAAPGVRPEGPEVHAAARAGTVEAAGPAGKAAHKSFPEESPVDARAIDAELRATVTERQRQDALLVDHLRLMASERGYRDHGYASLEAYAADRLGLSHGALYNLLALGRRLDALPPLRAAFLEGRLTARQASLLGSVATVVSVEAWIERAERVTLRRLEDEVEYVQHLRESRPEVSDRLDGGPLPEGIVLAPGRAPRLRMEAPPGAGGDGVQASAPVPEEPDGSRGAAAVSAEAFLEALTQDEQVTPLPDRMCVIRLYLEPEVDQKWEAVLAHLRATVREDLKEWEALGICLARFWRVWDNEETRRQSRENPILELHGWRCAAPGCRSLGTGRLHVHHTIPRSQGGTDDPFILAPACTPHHLGEIHRGLVRCTGWAPDGLVWEMGIEPGRGPFQVFFGETLIAGPVP